MFVTHDQEEALAMSDRIAVMDAGRFDQVGAPAEIYRTPRSAYVADFIGAANIVDATLGAACEAGGVAMAATAAAMVAGREAQERLAAGDEVVLLLDPARSLAIAP